MNAPTPKTEKKPEVKGTVKAWAITISGSYRNADKEAIDFGGLNGFIPFIDEEIAVQQIRKRYAAMWIILSGKYKERLQSVREVFIDKMEVVEITKGFTYIGKNITDMTYEELQDMATANHLQEIPLYKKTSLRQSQNVAYAAFASKILKLQPKSQSKDDVRAWKLLTDYRTDGFNAMKNPPIIVGGKTHRDYSQKISNEEVIEQEMKSAANPKTTLTMEELQEIARQKKIDVPDGIAFNDLYNLLYVA